MHGFAELEAELPEPKLKPPGTWFEDEDSFIWLPEDEELLPLTEPTFPKAAAEKFPKNAGGAKDVTSALLADDEVVEANNGGQGCGSEPNCENGVALVLKRKLLLAQFAEAVVNDVSLKSNCTKLFLRDGRSNF